jgi:glycosyltransferase involved in cell wall biosynthesis
VGTPYILEPRGAYDPHIVARRRDIKRLWWRIAERRLVHEAAAIHVFYEEERSALEALGYRGAVVVVPNGTAANEGIRWMGGGGYLLFLGRFDVQHKGLDLLLEGLASLPARERPLVRLHGSDHAKGGRRALQKLVNRYELETWIRIGEPIFGRDKQHALAACDGFVYPSRWDACPNAVLEAVGIGIPTVATPYPLARDLADQGAVILAPATAAGIADGLRELARDPVRQAVAARGPDVISRSYAWEKVGRSWLEQVEDVLARWRAMSPPPLAVA